MITAHQRDASIRVVTDRTQSRGKSSRVSEITSSGIRIRTSQRYKIEHNKFAVFDGTDVVTRSFNWTRSASARNSENCVFITDDTQKIRAYAACANMFAAAWENVPVVDCAARWHSMGGCSSSHWIRQRTALIRALTVPNHIPAD